MARPKPRRIRPRPRRHRQLRHPLRHQPGLRRLRRPLVSGAAIRAEGQIAVFDPRDENSPCYQCLYAEVGEATLSCSETGVLGSLVGMIGTTQAMEAIKLLAQVGAPLTGRLLILDAWRMHWREMKIPPDPQCKVCGNS